MKTLIPEKKLWQILDALLFIDWVMITNPDAKTANLAARDRLGPGWTFMSSLQLMTSKHAVQLIRVLEPEWQYKTLDYKKAISYVYAGHAVCAMGEATAGHLVSCFKESEGLSDEAKLQLILKSER